MNKTHFWACATLCLTGIACPHPASSGEPPEPFSRAFYNEDVDCSGLPGYALMPQGSAAIVPGPARLPYGFRWDDYQGAEIEHDIYGDRRQSSSIRVVPHVPLSAVAARKFNGLFAGSGHRSGTVSRYPVDSQPLLVAAPPTDCGCANQVATPIAPAPVPLVTIPTTPISPMPEAPTPVPSQEISPDPVPLTTIPQAVPQVEQQPSEEPSPALPSQPMPLQPTISLRLVPTQISLAAPPAGVPVTKAAEIRRNELQRNKIPTNATKSEKSKSKGDFGEFFYELLLGPRK